MIIREIYAKSILSKSRVFDYTVNPYVGCQHGCTYCYARFMKRFTSHKEAWGEFVDAKVNATELLKNEIKNKKVGRVWISGICDPYQPLEKAYELTKGCLEILSKRGWPVTIQTKSPLVLRDMELLTKSNQIEVGLTITTADENIRKIFEPESPTVKERIETLEKLHSVGVKTFAMIAPLLPKAEGLVAQLSRRVHYVLVDKMNYHYADHIYRRHELEYAMANNFFTQKKIELANAFRKEGIPYQMLF